VKDVQAQLARPPVTIRRTTTSGVIDRTFRFGCHGALPVLRLSPPAAGSIPILLPGADVALLVNATSTALFTDAVGGGWVGVHGIVGVGVGIAVGIFPMMVFRLLRRGQRLRRQDKVLREKMPSLSWPT